MARAVGDDLRRRVLAASAEEMSARSVGAIQFGSGMIGSVAVGLSAVGTPTSMILVMAVGGIGAALMAPWMGRQEGKS